MPWVHFHVTQQGTVTPCCNTPWGEEHSFGNINKESLQDIWHGKKINNFRKSLREGKRDYRCERCYEKEKTGWLSLREITNEKYKHHIEWVRSTSSGGVLPLPVPIYLDIRFSNICNLQCRICGPWASSKWHEDAIALGWKKKDEKALTCAIKDVDHLFRQLEPIVDHLEEIYFAGGEPLLMEEHYRILELLINKNKINTILSYNTNFTKTKLQHRNVLELWQHFTHINLALSLDGYGTRAEYMRSPCNWETIENNFSELRKHCPHAEVIISSTISVLNLMHLPDFHKYWVNEGKIKVEDCVPTMLMEPDYLNIRILPQALKLQAQKKYTEHITWMEKQPVYSNQKYRHAIQQFRNVIPHLYSKDNSSLLATFRNYIKKVDHLRHQTAENIFPELLQILIEP